MEYKLIDAEISNKSKLIEYKLKNVLEYSENLPQEEINKIKEYVNSNISEQIKKYKIINIKNKNVGCVLVNKNDDGVLIDEIYIEKEYRNNGIGTDIIKNILQKNNIVYLWVYKLNKKAISLYKKLEFKIIKETETRYYMRYNIKKEK